MKNRSISVMCQLNNSDDEVTYRRLQRYCNHMDIGLSTTQINNTLILTFTGTNHELMELEEHLEGMERTKL